MTAEPPIRSRQPRAPRLVGGSPPRLLGTIDLGEGMGFTMGPIAADTPPSQVRCWTERLKATTKMGAFVRSSDDVFRNFLSTPGLVAIAVEKPDTNGNGYFGIRKNMALLGHLYYWADFYGFAYENIEEISVTAAKLRLAGHGRADKDAMIAAAKHQGFDVDSEHSADAVGIRQVRIFGKAETKAERMKRESAERRALKEAAKPTKLL